jgi:anti-anti-sigma factor
MNATTESDTQNEYFLFTQHGDIAIIEPSPEVEQLRSNVIDTAAQVVLSPLKENPSTNVIVDLSRVTFFGSEFISFLLNCHLVVKRHDCELVLAGVSPQIRELLRQTALDTLWAIYDNRKEALEALGSY